MLPRKIGDFLYPRQRFGHIFVTRFQRSKIQQDFYKMTIMVNHPISASDMDHSVSPKDSFYHHVNGIWLKETSIPAEFSRWGAFTVLAEEAKAALKIIFDESSQKPNESILGFLYNAAMDTEAIESAGITGVEVLLTQVQAIETVHDLVNVIAKIQTELSSAIFFSHGPEPDSKNSDMVILSMGQGGLGLPDRDYYFDESKSDIRTKYIEHIETVFKLLDVDQLTCTSNAEAVFNFEKQIAEFSLKREDRRDPIKAYNKVNLAELRELASEFNWNAFFEAIGLGLDFGPIILERKEYFSSLIGLITKTQPQIIKNYLTFHIIKESSPKLSEKFVNEHFKFYETALKGTQQLQPLWKRRIDQVCGMIQDIVSQEYVKRNFSEESKAMALDLVEFIIVAFKERIQEIEWMCAETKARALQKLNSFRVKIGYPDKWIDYTQLGNIRNCKTYIEMSRLANKFNHDHDYKEINQKTDRLKWMMPPFMVNACKILFI